MVRHLAQPEADGFLAFLPQFFEAPSGLFYAQLMWPGGVFVLATFAVFALYAIASAAARDLVLGAVLIGLAARLAVTDP